MNAEGVEVIRHLRTLGAEQVEHLAGGRPGDRLGQLVERIEQAAVSATSVTLGHEAIDL